MAPAVQGNLKSILSCQIVSMTGLIGVFRFLQRYRCTILEIQYNSSSNHVSNFDGVMLRFIMCQELKWPQDGIGLNSKPFTCKSVPNPIGHKAISANIRILFIRIPGLKKAMK